jgi:hypothetical protein
VPVVIYAAKTTQAQTQEAYDLGVQSFHRKPYLESLIQEEIAKVQGKAWYWSFFEPDDEFCRRTGSSLLRRGVALEALIPSVKSAAQASKAALDKSKPFKEPIVTTIEAAGPFYAAEGYHQDYYKKNPVRYNYYRTSCGRDARLQQLWGKP